MEWPRSSRRSVALLVAACTGLLVVWLDAGGTLEPMELAAADKLTQVFAVQSADRAADFGRATMIWITEDDIARLGHPLTDQQLAAVLSAILSAQPVAVGVDLYRDRVLPPGSQTLQALLLAEDRVVMAEKLADSVTSGIPAPAYLAPDRRGFSDVPVDDDGSVRRLFLMLWDAQDRAHLSLPLRVALQVLQREQHTITPHAIEADWIDLGASPMPPLLSGAGGYGAFDDRGYQYLLQPEQRLSIPSFTVSELLAGSVPDQALYGRMIFVATAADSVKDLFPIATSRAEYGGLIHAMAANQLVQFGRGLSTPIQPWSAAANSAWIAAWAVFAALAVIALERKSLQLAALMLAAITIGAVVYVGRSESVWILSVAPLLALILTAMALWSFRAWIDRRDKAQVFSLFGAFVAKPVVAEIWSNRANWSRGRLPEAKQAPVTVLIADLSGFSAAANTMEAAQLMLWLENYMEAMSEQAERFGGVVNDFIGDGVMVNFGVPNVRESSSEIARDADNALHCAASMCRALDDINRRWQAQGVAAMRMRIGVASGTVVAGVYGSKGRMKYTTIGATVNLAARLENIDKASFIDASESHRVLVAAHTVALVRAEHALTPIGKKSIKGFDTPIELYALDLSTEQESRHEETSPAAGAQPLHTRSL